MFPAPTRSASVTRWFTPEGPAGEPGVVGATNHGAKGRAFVPLAAGEALTLAEMNGSGTVRRIWLTLSDLSPTALRGLRLDAFWDGADEPAVSAPVGELFGAALGCLVAVETEVFSSPEGRSLCLTVPMPFRTAARVVLTNETSTDVQRGGLCRRRIAAV